MNRLVDDDGYLVLVGPGFDERWAEDEKSCKAGKEDDGFHILLLARKWRFSPLT
jgi:hypothetical protein